ncbi:MAG: 16S rRNA (cytosine(1402)-N(4))-methyltransferase [Lentisphaerae bacterium RIFOXYB12_FULL_65_16]|nr:MAG: 16S rRNA (cytosine(1402)-N(4))-methyltransferase [Lentisphaerae bacterium RIFOXYA12_64_32]OGV84319.1 MAG: 16S rRNA (cytosine(1402)-N(4))-methyltransferase [Lentisphaerae bacterium RIFOXYB12_FULL_65_16]
MELSHLPVMPKEVLDLLGVSRGGRFIDGTLGLGGHAELLLASSPEVQLLGIDRDGEAIRHARVRLERFGDRVRLVRGCYGDMAKFAAEQGWDHVDGILLDLGVCSGQIDEPGRGFSHRFDGPLDMRMDRRSPISAATLLNENSEEELGRILREYGEERHARRIARAAVERRQTKPWERTLEFAEMANRLGDRRRGGVPPATRCFQALRIAVNDELGQLQKALRIAVILLRQNGRVVVISFHSLEDRMVKHFFRAEAAACVCPPELPVCNCGKKVTLRVVTTKPVRPTDAEVAENRRAASARLRAAERP